MYTPGWTIGLGHRDAAETIGLVCLKLLGIKFTVPSVSRGWSLGCVHTCVSCSSLGGQPTGRVELHFRSNIPPGYLVNVSKGYN